VIFVADEQTAERTVADFWFDAICPWAWITSRWMLEVQRVRPVTVRWHVMCLSILNQANEKTERYQKLMDSSLATGRLAIAAARWTKDREGDASAVLGSLYTELGASYHVRGIGYSLPLYEEALASIGLPTHLALSTEDDGLDEELLASHTEGMHRVGTKVGTPIISARGNSFFGPVVTPAPKGEHAGRLWDGVLLVSETDGFFELKRTRDRKPQFD
jgi:hypothetical protein